MGMIATRPIEEYLQNKYQIVLTPEYGAWTASVPDLPGCIAVGDTPQEAATLIEDAKRSWISASLEKQLPVPEPSNH